MQRSFSAPVGVVDPYLQRSFSAPVGLVDPYFQRSFSASVGPADPYDPLDGGFAPTAAHAPFWERRARFAPLAPLPAPPAFMDYARRFAPAAWGRDAPTPALDETLETLGSLASDARARDAPRAPPGTPALGGAAHRVASATRATAAFGAAARGATDRRGGGAAADDDLARFLASCSLSAYDASLRETLGVAEVCRRARDPRRIRG